MSIGRLVSKIFLFVLVFSILAGVAFYFYIGKTSDVAKYIYDTVSNPKSESVPAANPTEQVEPAHGYLSAPLLNSRTQSYWVNGSSREELCHAIWDWQKANEKEDTLAEITYTIPFNYKIIQTSRGYTIGEFSVTIETLITTPQWTSSSGASEGTKSDWREFKNAVSSHEREHQDLVVEYAQKIVDSYNGLGYYESYDKAENAISSIYDGYFAELESAQNKYDDEHGTSDSFSYLCR